MARRSAHAAVQPTNSQSSASDADGDEIQRVDALTSLLQTPKTNQKELQDFRAKVATDQQELKSLLAQRMRQAEQTSLRRRNELTEAILKALQTPNRVQQGNAPTLGETKIARNAVFKSVASVLKASEFLVGEYDRLDKIIVGIRDAEPEDVAETWTEDRNMTARLLKIGADTAIRNVKKVLGADVEIHDTGNVDGETLADGDTMEALEEMELNYDLHRSLQSVERGVKKMVKSLPEQDVG